MCSHEAQPRRGPTQPEPMRMKRHDWYVNDRTALLWLAAFMVVASAGMVAIFLFAL
jgi:hypothetical protein